VSGLLLRNPSDVDAFATILDQLLARPALAAKLGKNARNRVRQQYLGLRSLAQYADLIERLRIIHERAKRNGEASRKIGHRSDSRPEAYTTVRRGRGARGRPVLPKIRRCSRGFMNYAG
jgi:hypothetical protein